MVEFLFFLFLFVWVFFCKETCFAFHFHIHIHLVNFLSSFFMFSLPYSFFFSISGSLRSIDVMTVYLMDLTELYKSTYQLLNNEDNISVWNRNKITTNITFPLVLYVICSLIIKRLLLYIDLRPGQTCHSKVMHRKEVTHSDGSYEKKSRRRAWLKKMGQGKIPWYTHRLMHRKRVTCELHDSYFRLMTIKHAIPEILNGRLNDYITRWRQEVSQGW